MYVCISNSFCCVSIFYYNALKCLARFIFSITYFCLSVCSLLCELLTYRILYFYNFTLQYACVVLCYACIHACCHILCIVFIFNVNIQLFTLGIVLPSPTLTFHFATFEAVFYCAFSFLFDKQFYF